MASRDGDRVVVVAFVADALLAGGNAVAIRFSNRELPPLWGATMRFVLAAAIMVALTAALRLALPTGRALAGALLYGVFQFGASFALLYYALVHVHAGLGQTLLALVPLATLLLAVAQRQERLRASAVVGTFLGLAGVALMSRDPLQESVPLLSLLAVLGSVVCFAQAAVIVRMFPPLHPVVMNAIGMLVGGCILAAGSVLAGESIRLPERRETWIALGYVVVVGSIAVFLLYVFILQRWTASRASYVLVLVPFVAVALSAWLDHEPVHAGLVIGGLFVIAGVYSGALRGSRPADPDEALDVAAPHAGE